MQPREVAHPPEIFVGHTDADFPFNRPIALATLYFGGMLKQRCT